MHFRILFLIALNWVNFGSCCYLPYFDVCISLDKHIDFLIQWMIGIYESLTPLVDYGKKYSVTFELYTRAKMTSPDVYDVADVHSINKLVRDFDRSKSTFFVVHGFLSDKNHEFGVQVRETYLKYKDVNVFVVNWSDLASKSSYKYVVENIDLAADRIAKMLEILRDDIKLDLDLITLVGFSLGAHLVGMAGNRVKSEVGVIVGLDPANAEISSLGPAKRLSSDHAKYVLVIHTNVARLGNRDPIGTADFYVGDGTTQPGCHMSMNIKNYFKCSHKRSWQLFAESIYSTIGFWGRKCNTVTEARCTGLFMEINPCSKGELAPMGGFTIDRKINGIYHINTNVHSPFAIPKHRS